MTNRTRLVVGGGLVALGMVAAISMLAPRGPGPDLADPGLEAAPSPEPTSTPVPAQPTAEPSPTPPPSPTPASATPGESAVPLRVRVPDIGVDAEMIELGTNPDGTLEVPEDFAQVGWFNGRAIPGLPGPAVLAGHVDSFEGPAVFFELSELEAGDVVEVDLDDGTTARYRVVEVFEVDKDEFPTELVYGPTDGPELRLITCGGSFNPDARSYESNVIVLAHHIDNRPTTSIS